MMLRQEDSSLPPFKLSEIKLPKNGKKYSRKLYALLTGVAVIIIIIVALMVPQISGLTLKLNLNYAVGDHMVYKTTNIIINQKENTTLLMPPISTTQSYNSTITMDVTGYNNENFTINEYISGSPTYNISHISPIILNVSKSSYINNFVAPGAPLIFYNSNNNSIISAYLAQTTVKVGDVWKIPVNTFNVLTGEVTLTFAGFQDLTVQAGTYKTMRIEVASNVLQAHSDGTTHITYPDGMTLQMNGTSYIEQGTCRLIKADLTQISTLNSPGINRTAIIYNEKTLVEFTKP
jgi:hypothetical protein